LDLRVRRQRPTSLANDGPTLNVIIIENRGFQNSRCLESCTLVFAQRQRKRKGRRTFRRGELQGCPGGQPLKVPPFEPLTMSPRQLRRSLKEISIAYRCWRSIQKHSRIGIALGLTFLSIFFSILFVV
jgi:hypothetical protein